MSGHTPGPWVISQESMIMYLDGDLGDGDSSIECLSIVKFDGEHDCESDDIVASVEMFNLPAGMPSTNGGKRLTYADNYRANAALIAAAPDLRDACVLSLECSDYHDIDCRCGRDARSAAIALAKGEKK